MDSANAEISNGNVSSRICNGSARGHKQVVLGLARDGREERESAREKNRTGTNTDACGFIREGESPAQHG